MAYVCHFSETHSIYLDNIGDRTVVTTANRSPGQQQQSSSSFTTGNWTQPPQVFQASGGIEIAIFGSRGDCTIQVRGSSIAVTSDRVSAANAQPLQVQSVANVPISTMPPMEPMKMGNMFMSGNPMEMRMGNMEMRMGSPAGSPRFCSQCGAAVKPDDRFCSSCGHRLG